MQITKLTLENFQGITALEVDLSTNSQIQGANGTGKSTVANAICWLLLDRNFAGTKNYSPRPRLIDLEAVTSVTATLDGTLTIKKVLSEKWSKKRGELTPTFDGYTTTYDFDGVPVAKKEFEEKLSTVLGSYPQIRMVPTAFSGELSTEERRKILIDIVGGISELEIIADIGDQRELLAKENSGTYTPAEYKTIASKKQKELAKELDGIPARIKTLQDTIQITSKKEDIEAKISELDARIQTLKGNPDLANRELILTKKEELQKLKQVDAVNEKKFAEELNKEKDLLRIDRIETQAEVDKLQAEVENITAQVSDFEAKRKQLLLKYSILSAEKFEAGKICALCDTVLTEANYNLQKAKKLAEINAEGKKSCSKELIETTKTTIEAKKLEIIAKETLLKEIAAKVTVANAKAYVSSNQDITKLETQIFELEQAELKKIGNAPNPELEQEEKRKKDAYLELANLEGNQHAEKLIAEYKEREKTISTEHAKLEKALNWCEKYLFASNKLLEDKINGKFENIRFSMFKKQINGEILPDCEVLVRVENEFFVPFAYANTALKINSGIEIINFLAEHVGVSLPIIVDNAESVTSFTATDSQLIKLVVSAEHQELSII